MDADEVTVGGEDRYVEMVVVVVVLRLAAMGKLQWSWKWAAQECCGGSRR